MPFNAPRSYATALRLSTQGTRLGPASHRFTPTLFQAEHSVPGTDAEGKDYTPPGRTSAVPRTLLKRPTSRATLNDSFVTQKQSSMLQTQAGQAEQPPRCITDLDWLEPERRSFRGGEPSKQQASFAPTEYMSPPPKIPAHHELGSVSLSCSDDTGPKDSASTLYDKPPPSATGHSFQPAVSFVPGSMTSLNPRKSQRTLTAGDELDMKRWYGANGGKSTFVSTPRLSTKSCATGAFVKASTRTYTTLPGAASPSSVQQAPTPDGPGREPSVMPQQSKASQADFGPLKFYDWAESVYDPAFESQPAPASTKCLSQSSVPNTLHAPESGAVRCDTNSYSQDSLILSSDSSPVFSTAASSKGDQSSTPTGTAVPHGSGRSRGFKRLGTGIFGQLHEKYPPSQSR